MRFLIKVHIREALNIIKMSRIVVIGGGHVNCQVLKIMKTKVKPGDKLILISESPCSYYSGMLPGSVASKYHCLTMFRALQT